MEGDQEQWKALLSRRRIGAVITDRVACLSPPSTRIVLSSLRLASCSITLLLITIPGNTLQEQCRLFPRRACVVKCSTDSMHTLLHCARTARTNLIRHSCPPAANVPLSPSALANESKEDQIPGLLTASLSAFPSRATT
ncbi:hypothetical protein DAEQUDRAFT_289054 [Daedalea quercina L-15889]|uniref:Uncharacterized protein n=1 Tax=Daedalea quercina L-15889 TaxID=1314783 RepID=A0A165TXB7_9APHY|nr:hypothetical protein DAEQUDRAFT_289054 [Daedalea quercina L-15889]